MPTAYADAINVDTPVGFWKLDETTGTNAADAGSGVNPGTYTGGYTLAQACPNNPDTGNAAVLMNGTTGYVNVATVTSLPTGATLRTIEVLVKLTGAGGMLVGMNTASGQKFHLEAWTNGTWYLFTDGVNANNNITLTGSEIPDLGYFNHIVFVMRSTTTWEYWLNGVLKKSGTFGTAINTAALTSVFIGNRADAGGQFLAGTIDTAAIFNTALSQARIEAHYAALLNISKARLTTEVIEAVVEPTPKLRLSSAIIEAVFDPIPKLRLTSAVVEVIHGRPAGVERNRVSVTWQDS